MGWDWEVAGVHPSHPGEVIAVKMSWSRNWVGLVLLATVASRPELITGVSAVTLAHTPDVALGDVLGSCVFNRSILIIVDGLHRHESLYTRASQARVLSALALSSSQLSACICCWPARV